MEFLHTGGLVQEVDAAMYFAGVANQPLVVAMAKLIGDVKEDYERALFNSGQEV